MRTLGIQILVGGLILTVLLRNSHAFNSEKFKITHSKMCSSTETMFRILYGKSLSECVFECNIRPKCAAINYRKRRIQCELLESSISTTFVPNSDQTGPCVYIHRRNISLNASEHCGNNCTSGQVCDTNSGKCIIQECQPLSLANGAILGNMCNVGARLRIKCIDGFAEIGDNMYTVCNTSGQWDPAIRCITDCPPAVAPFNGQVSAPNSYEGETSAYTCLDGYTLIGSETATCAKGAWSPSAPLCKRVRDCYDVLHLGVGSISGNYTVHLQSNVSLDVYCDMVTDGGRWTVFQYRHDGSVDFYRTFLEYENGFGDVHGEFWMGLKYIHEMTDKKTSEIYLQFVDSNGNIAMERFNEFYISAGANYTLHVGALLQQNDTTPNLSLLQNNGSRFSAKDVDNKLRCAYYLHSAWWYNACGYLNPNGEFVTPGQNSSLDRGWGGMVNYGWKGYASLKSTKLMFRRI